MAVIGISVDAIVYSVDEGPATRAVAFDGVVFGASVESDVSALCDVLTASASAGPVRVTNASVVAFDCMVAVSYLSSDISVCLSDG